MNPTGKKIISLLLVFSLMMLPTSLYAKKRGAKLIVIKKDGGQIEGELITVKPNSLLLLNTDGKDVSVDVEEIKVIKIVYKKSVFVRDGALRGLLGGFAVGASITGMYALMLRASGGEALSYMAQVGGVAALVGLIAGAIVRAILKPVEPIKIEGKSDKKIQKTMDKLRKKARVRNYK